MYLRCTLFTLRTQNALHIVKYKGAIKFCQGARFGSRATEVDNTDVYAWNLLNAKAYQ